MPDTSATPWAPRVAVIGAGIIGACVALALRRRGADVVLIERGEPGHGASYGNSGAISEGSVMPLSTPGILAKVPSMLLDPRSPLHVPLTYLPKALPWLMRFVAAARPAEVERIAQALHALHREAVEHHLALAADIGAADLVVRRGHLHLYPDDAALTADQGAWSMRQRMGIKFERLDRAGIGALEPAIGDKYNVGMFLPDHAMVVNPLRYVQAIVAAFQQAGGRLIRDEVRAVRPASGADVAASGWSTAASGWNTAASANTVANEQSSAGHWTVHGAAARYGVDHVVLAAGVWSAALLEPLGVSVALESQRGYHSMFTGIPSPIARTVVLTDHKIFATPMEEGLRVGGMVEIAGLKKEPDMRRAEWIAGYARESIHGLDGAVEKTWMGHRPCLPDSLPKLGPAPGLPGLWLAFGHGHLGLTDSANSARLICTWLFDGKPVGQA